MWGFFWKLWLWKLVQISLGFPYEIVKKKDVCKINTKFDKSEKVN